jgi:hypothetical protein
MAKSFQVPGTPFRVTFGRCVFGLSRGGFRLWEAVCLRVGLDLVLTFCERVNGAPWGGGAGNGAFVDIASWSGEAMPMGASMLRTGQA